MAWFYLELEKLQRINSMQVMPIKFGCQLLRNVPWREPMASLVVGGFDYIVLNKLGKLLFDLYHVLMMLPIWSEAQVTEIDLVF